MNRLEFTCPINKCVVLAPPSLEGEEVRCPKCGQDVPRWPSPRGPATVPPLRVVPPASVPLPPPNPHPAFSPTPDAGSHEATPGFQPPRLPTGIKVLSGLSAVWVLFLLHLRAFASDFRLPAGKGAGILRWLIGWMTLGTFVKLYVLINERDPSTAQVLLYLPFALVGQYLFGAFWSKFEFVYISAMVSTVIFIVAVCMRGQHAKPVAKAAATCIFSLSLFTLWIEPWITISGIVVNLILMATGFFNLIFEVIMSIIGLLLLGAAYVAIDSEQ
jgi:hypothetical protein